MARRKSKQPTLGYIIIAAFLSITAWISLNLNPEPKQAFNNKDLLEVHFIDVGQADSILIEQGESALLIDGGNNEDTEEVVDYLHKENISELDYVVGTHPHEDHIGGLDGVINQFKVDDVMMPDIVNDSKTYDDVVSAVENKGLAIDFPQVGRSYSLGNTQFTILSPAGSKYDEINDYSIAIRMVYKEISFLFLGDCEDVNEKEMLKSGQTLDADVIKLGHHGSDSSTTEDFLEAVNPQYAVISVGKNNDYKHPSKEVLERLKNNNINILRTDENGTIVFTTDGDSLTVSEDKP